MNKEQYQVLKELKIKTYIEDWSQEKKQIVTFLCSQRLCEYEIDISSPWQNNTGYCRITELGKSVLYDYKKDLIRFRLPLALSIIAVIISAIALLKP